jgi:hypothetical protein
MGRASDSAHGILARVTNEIARPSAGSFRLLEREPLARTNLHNPPHNRSACLSIRWARNAADRLKKTENRSTHNWNTFPGSSRHTHIHDGNVHVKRQRANHAG